MDKNKNKDSSSKNNRAFVIILLALIILIILIFGCFNQYRRQQRRRSLSLRDTIEQTHQEPPLLEGEPSSGLHLWVKTRRRWRNFRSGLPSYNHARTIQNTTNAPTTSTVIPSEQPPSYEGSTLIRLTILTSHPFFFVRFIPEYNYTNQFSFKFTCITKTKCLCDRTVIYMYLYIYLCLAFFLVVFYESLVNHIHTHFGFFLNTRLSN